MKDGEVRTVFTPYVSAIKYFRLSLHEIECMPFEKYKMLMASIPNTIEDDESEKFDSIDANNLH